MHTSKLIARGLDPGSARFQAEALCKDPNHRAGCSLCAGNSHPPNGRCQGVSKAGECRLPVVAGTRFCRHHQGQAG